MMLKRLRILTEGMARRQQTAALCITLFVLGLAVYGFICSLWLWGIVLAVVACLAVLYGIALILWKRYSLSTQEKERKSVSGFAFWSISKNKMNEPDGYQQESLSIPLKPIHDESEVLRATTVNSRKFVTAAEVKLTLGRTPNEQDSANCDNFLEWLRTDAHGYDAIRNQSGCGGFPRYYPTAVEISGQHLVIRLVVMNSFAAVRYVKNPPQIEVPEVSFDDDDFSDIPDDNELI